VIACIALAVTAFAPESHGQPPIATADGFGQGATGGGDATPIHVSTASAFQSAAGDNTAKVIVVHGNLNVGDFSVGSNKTIVGVDESAGLSGGRIAVNGTNYIFQNLTFGPAAADVMEVSGGTHVFITKCSFHDAGDELLSIVREADYVTVSWCKFYFDNSHSHAFGHLIGNSDDRTTDRGKLHVTMHHNWYAEGVVGRMPRVRYGQVHLYNNYYNSTGSGYCIGIGFECHIRLENTHFDNVDDPWADYGGTTNGEIGWAGLKFDGCSQPTFMPNAFPVFEPPYDYTPAPVDDVKALVMAGAGNVMDATAPSERRTRELSPAQRLEIYPESRVVVDGGTRIAVYDSRGRLAMKRSADGEGRTLDMANLPRGYYVITAQNHQTGVVKELLKY
jgi:pectate lyase